MRVAIASDAEAGNIDLLEEVANDELDDLLEDVTTATPKKEDVATDELDDLFVDVSTASPKKEDRSLAKTLREKKKGGWWDSGAWAGSSSGWGSSSWGSSSGGGHGGGGH